MEVTILPIRGTDLITVMDHTMAAARSWWPLAIDLTIGVPDIGQAARITCGGPATGYGGTVGKYGSAAITSCEDTNPRPVPQCRYFSRLPSRD